MVPHTDDGRVLFAIPWHQVVVVGTTDTPVAEASLEPVPLEEEVEFLLSHAARYLTKDPQRGDVLSCFAGLRPLVGSNVDGDTSSISRDHSLTVSASGLLTITGGKWTTYRKMAEDVVDHALTLGDLEPRPCVTQQFPIHGYHRHAERFGALAFYGSDATEIELLAETDERLRAPLHPRLGITGAEVRWACRREMARTVDDVLSRRTRCLLFDAQAAIEVAPRVAELMATELGYESCPMIGFDPAQVSEIVGLPDDHEPLMLVVAGKGTKPAWDRLGLLDFEELASVDRFGQNTITGAVEG